MKYLIILPLLLITAVLWSQPIDDKRMKREIEIAENILATLVEESPSNFFGGMQVEGTYLEGYGLLFSIQNKFGQLRLAQTTPVVIEDGKAKGYAESRAWAESRANVTGIARASNLDADSTATAGREKIEDAAKTFLADYGHLLTQLPDQEKVCIKYVVGSSNGLFGRAGTISIGGAKFDRDVPGFTMVLPKRAVEDHRTGKIDRKKLIAQIEYTENKPNNSVEDREFVLLNSIFHRAYQSDLSDGFFMRGKGNMERIPGLGLLFSYQFSSRGDRTTVYLNNGEYRFYFPDGDSDRDKGLGRVYRINGDEDKEDEDEEWEEPDFDDFLEGFKANIIEYGSTVRSLKDDEVLSFELGFPSCNDCDRPETVKITAKQSILKQYRAGTLDLEDAKEKLQVLIVEE